MIFHNLEFLILLGLYLVHLKQTRKVAYIAAFLFCEVFSRSAIEPYLTPALLYLFYACIYCLLYFIALINDEKFTTKLFIIIDIVVLCMGSAIDATVYPYDETLFYNAYPILYVLIHFCIVISFMDGRSFKRIMGETVNFISSFFGHVYHHSLFWYNLRKSTKEAKK